jgi:hypothetical protein
MAPSDIVTSTQITYMTMEEYLSFRAGNPPVVFERTYEYCRRMYIETGNIYWLNEMIERVSPWETGG